MDACKTGIALEITRLARRMYLTPSPEDHVKVQFILTSGTPFDACFKSIMPQQTYVSRMNAYIEPAVQTLRCGEIFILWPNC